jgi:hypothetical protein
LPVIAIVVIR